VTSEHCTDAKGRCNVLPIGLFEQTGETSKLHDICNGRRFENFKLCQAIKDNKCVVDSNTGHLLCSSCCAGGSTWLGAWHVHQDSKKNLVKYKVECDQKHGYTYEIHRHDTNLKRWVEVLSDFTLPPPSGISIEITQGQTSGSHGNGGGGNGGAENIKRRRLLQAAANS